MKAIDLFAGAGGFSLGAERAGARVVWAGNHWLDAVEVHRLNHPSTDHACQDLRQADWTALPRFDLLLAAPSCVGHSSASQARRRPYHDAIRATAWAVVDCADVTEPRAIAVENVLHMRRWRLYGSWRAALERLGYRLTELVVLATDHGVPQLRRRLFVVGTRKARKVLAPVPSSALEPAFGPCLDVEASGWFDVAAAPPGARARMLAAQRRCGSRCLSQHTTGHVGVPLSEPIRTITGQHDHWLLVDGPRYRYLTPRELARAQGFPDSYSFGSMSASAATLAIGNAVAPPVGEAVVRAVQEAA